MTQHRVKCNSMVQQSKRANHLASSRRRRFQWLCGIHAPSRPQTAGTQSTQTESQTVTQNRSVQPPAPVHTRTLKHLTTSFQDNLSLLAMQCEWKFVRIHSPEVLSNRTIHVSRWRKSAQRRRKHCALAVVRPSQKISPRHRPPSRGHGTAKT